MKLGFFFQLLFLFSISYFFFYIINIQFVDERLKLEKDLVLLKTQNDRLRAQLEENKQENEELRQEIYLLRNHRNGIDEGINFFLFGVG